MSELILRSVKESFYDEAEQHRAELSKFCDDVREWRPHHGPGREAAARYLTWVNAERTMVLAMREAIADAERQRWQAERDAHEVYYAMRARLGVATYEDVLKEATTIVFAHYGTTCACCASTDDLAIDHIDGTGGTHRKQSGVPAGGRAFYKWLVYANLPPGYQALCKPCNSSKGIGAHCRINHG